MQFNRSADGTMEPLPKPSVDTGMGLERIAAVLQNVHSNYEIDLFQHLLAATAKATNTEDMDNKSLRVIADHIRSCAFLVVDGVLPSNEGRGYVLRRIIRRAIRHGHKLGQKAAFFHQLVAALVAEMGDAYPELAAQQAHVEKVLLAEEQQFAKTLDNGLGVLETALKALKGTEIPGDVVFKLHDTYGFPTDLTNDIARERELTLDLAAYEACMAEQRARARAAGKFKVDYNDVLVSDQTTEFLGYDHLVSEGEVLSLFKDGKPVDQLLEGEDGVVLLKQTPFYAESGGQVGDTGFLNNGDNRFEVRDCQKSQSAFLHIGRVLGGAITVGDVLDAKVDHSLRQAIALNHSATHLLHAALRSVLGAHVAQKGSLVDSERLRFDFSHLEAVTHEELKRIEQMVNEHIRLNTPVATEVCSMDEAREKGAMMLFGEKYGDEVRVLSMGEGFSVELCGGTHVERTGDIGLMRIVAESGISAGVRRIEAITGQKALVSVEQMQSQLNDVAALLKANSSNTLEKLQQLIDSDKASQKQLAALQAKLASSASGDLLSHAKEINGVTVLAHQVDGANAKSLRDMADALKSKMQSGIFLLAAADGEKVALIAGVTDDLKKTHKAGDLMKLVAPIVGGKGGGRPDMAQGGGTDVSQIPQALAAVEDWVKA